MKQKMSLKAMSFLLILSMFIGLVPGVEFGTQKVSALSLGGWVADLDDSNDNTLTCINDLQAGSSNISMFEDTANQILYVGWSEYVNSSYKIRIKKYHNDTWTYIEGASPLMIEDTGCYGFKLTVNNGVLYAAWLEFHATNPNGTYLHVKKYNSDTQAWSAIDGGTAYGLQAEPGTTTRSTSQGFDMITYNGDLYVAFSENRDMNVVQGPQNRDRIMLAKYSGTGSDWTFTTSLNVGENTDSYNVKLAAGSTDLYVAWSEVPYSTTTQNAYIITKKYNSIAGWSTIGDIGTVDTASPGHRRMCLATNGNDLFIVWGQPGSSEPYSILKGKKYTSSSGNWSAIDGGSYLNYDSTKSAYPYSLLVYNGELYLNWSEDTPNKVQVRVKKYNIASSTWSYADDNGITDGTGTEFGLSYYPEANDCYSTSLTVYNNQLIFGWSENNHLYLKKYDANFQVYQDSAWLSSLLVNNGMIKPAFSSSQSNYVVLVPNGIGTISFRPTASHAQASITLNGSSVINEQYTQAYNLDEGSNTFSFEVTSSRGAVVKEYWVNIIRMTADDKILLTVQDDVLEEYYKNYWNADFSYDYTTIFGGNYYDFGDYTDLPRYALGHCRYVVQQDANQDIYEIQWKSALKFNLAAIPTGYTSAALKLFVPSNDTYVPNGLIGTPQAKLYKASDDSWTENSNTFPLEEGLITTKDFVGFSQPGWLNFDVIDYINEELSGDKIASFVLKGTETAGQNNYFSFYPRENGTNTPYIEIVLPSDTVPPEISNKTLAVGGVTENGATLSWTKATDNKSLQEKLQYLLYYSSQNNLASIEEIEANGTPVGSFETDIASKAVTGLVTNSTYYFNVIVIDELGNKSVYDPVSRRIGLGYDVTFDSDEGTPIDVMIGISAGTVIAAPAPPTKDGFVFGGWYKEEACSNIWDFENDIVSDNITLYAKWTVSTCVVTYDPEGGTVNPTMQTKLVGYGYGKGEDGIEDAPMPIPIKEGYSFEGWYTEDNGTGTLVTGTTLINQNQNHILYAKWIDVVPPQLNTVTISSNNNVISTMAKTGDTISVDIVANEEILQPTVTIVGQPAIVQDMGDEDYRTWRAVYVLATDDMEGTVGIHIAFRDNANNEGIPVTSTTNESSVIFDSTAPLTPAALEMTEDSDSGVSCIDNITNINIPTFEGTAEVNSTVKLYRGGLIEIGNTTADGSGNWNITALQLEDGIYTITAKAVDGAGNESVSSEGLVITIDTDMPEMPVISTLEQATNTESIIITGTAEADTVIRITGGYEIAAGSVADESYSISVNLTRDAINTLMVKATDTAGNESGIASVVITQDSTLPTAPQADLTSGLYNGVQMIVLTTAEDAEKTYYTLDGSEPDDTKNEYTQAISIDEEDGITVTLKAVSYDDAGNRGGVTVKTYTFDKVSPTGSISINADAENTTSTQVVLSITATDGNGSGLEWVRFSNDETVWSEWEEISETKNWMITEQYGTATVYMQLKDRLGNVSGSIWDSIRYKSTPISMGSIVSGEEDQAILLSVSDFVYQSDDGSALTKVMVIALPEYGILTIDEEVLSVSQEIDLEQLGSIVVTPDKNWNGETSFVWKGYDGVEYSEGNAQMTFKIVAVNDAPIAKNGFLSTNAGMEGNGLLHAEDVDKEQLSYSIVQQPIKGTVTINNEINGDYVYTPNPGEYGNDNFTFKVYDGELESDVATVEVNIIPSGVADLKELYLSESNLTPEFSVNTMNYTVNVPNETNWITISGCLFDPYAGIKVNQETVTQSVYGQFSEEFLLDIGTNQFVIDVGAQNGETHKAYYIEVVRAASTVAELESLSLGKIVFTPVFDKNILTYSANVSNDVKSVTVKAGAYYKDAKVQVNGTLLTEQGIIITLNVGDNPIVIVVTAQDETTSKSYAVNIIREKSRIVDTNNDQKKEEQPAKPETSEVEILVNGKVETAATSTVKKIEDKIVTTVIVNDKKVEEKLATEGNKSVVTIPVKNNADIVVGQLNGQTVKNMEAKEAILEIKTENVTYTLPASQINIDNVSEKIGNQVELKDITVNVSIAASSQETVKIVEDTAIRNNYKLVVKPVEFNINCTNGNKTVEVSKFNGYVERMISIPDGIDPSKITTGIVLNHDGTFSHVPTTITVIDGKHYAKINSLTNSTYSVIWSPKTFMDVENHWAEDAINDMGSRLVIDGIKDGKFEPDRDITRAEFAAIVIRALGIMRPGTGMDVFSDVTKDDWYYDSVYIAYEYGIISGYENGKFQPEGKITREQAMTIIARAMKITNLKVELTEGEEDMQLSVFVDSEQSSVWAKESIMQCVKSGIILGRNGIAIEPKDSATRAEVAVIVKKLLQKSDLIN